MRVLVTGASGALGRATVSRLASEGHEVVASSSRDRSGERARGVTRPEWRRADLATGRGLGEAVAGVDAVVHLASGGPRPGRARQVDVEGTWRLGAAAREAGVGHLLYISIVGVDQVPLGYYRAKLAGEEATRSSGVPWTVLRATQFFSLVDTGLAALSRLPVMPLDAALLAQPVDPRDVAGAIAGRLQAGASESMQEYGGPETLSLADAAAAWLAARGKSRRTVNLPLPGAFGRAVRAGRLTTSAQPTGARTWQEWLDENYG